MLRFLVIHAERVVYTARARDSHWIFTQRKARGGSRICKYLECAQNEETCKDVAEKYEYATDCTAPEYKDCTDEVDCKKDELWDKNK